MPLDKKINNEEFEQNKDVKNLGLLKTEIRKSFGRYGEESVESLSVNSINNMYNKILDKSDLKRFKIQDTTKLNKFQKVAIVQSFLINCCNFGDNIIGAGSFYYRILKAVDGEYGVNTALAIRKALIDKKYFEEKGPDNKTPKNKFDGKITDAIVNELLKDYVLVDSVVSAAPTPVTLNNVTLEAKAADNEKSLKHAVDSVAAGAEEFKPAEKKTEELAKNAKLSKYGKNLNMQNISNYFTSESGDALMFDNLTIPLKNSNNVNVTKIGEPIIEENNIIINTKSANNNYYKITISKDGNIKSTKLIRLINSKEIKAIKTAENNKVALEAKEQSERVARTFNLIVGEQTGKEKMNLLFQNLNNVSGNIYINGKDYIIGQKEEITIGDSVIHKFRLSSGIDTLYLYTNTVKEKFIISKIDKTNKFALPNILQDFIINQ